MKRHSHAILGFAAGAVTASLMTLAAVHTKAPVAVAPRDPAKVAAGILPRPDLTPGATLQVDVATLCKRGYAGSVRNVSAEEKQTIYRAYGIMQHAPGQYEVDHACSLELGGDNTTSNLWPEKMHLNVDGNDLGAKTKDSLENRLHKEVCASRLSLVDAQKAILGDWTNCYLRYFEKFPIFRARVAGEVEKP